MLSMYRIQCKHTFSCSRSHRRHQTPITGHTTICGQVRCKPSNTTMCTSTRSEPSSAKQWQEGSVTPPHGLGSRNPRQHVISQWHAQYYYYYGASIPCRKHWLWTRAVNPCESRDKNTPSCQTCRRSGSWRVWDIHGEYTQVVEHEQTTRYYKYPDPDWLSGNFPQRRSEWVVLLKCRTAWLNRPSLDIWSCNHWIRTKVFAYLVSPLCIE